jgi:3-oxoacyl-(acyl-carrier-protein) synthase
MIQIGRAERMIVIAGDSASSDILMPWLGNGFRALGAATTCGVVSDASVPFNAHRSGMILGSGGIGMILESEEGAIRRYQLSQLQSIPNIVRRNSPFKCRLLGSLLSNSAYHGASMDRTHIAREMERFIASMELELNISRKEIAMQGVYFSHETSTHASPLQSCAANEVRFLLHLLVWLCSSFHCNYMFLIMI